MRFMGFIAIAALALTVATPAEAVLMSMTFTGKVTIVHYADATFGAGSLLNQNYKAVWTFDPGFGTVEPPYIGCAGCFDERTIGFAPNAPIRSLAITINGLTDTINFTSPAYSQNFISHTNNALGPYGSVSIGGNTGETVPSPVGPPYTAYSYFQGGSSYGAPASIPRDWTMPWAPPAGGSGSSGFLKQVQNAGRGYDQAYNFSGSVLSARIAAAVPETESWLLMIVGFGAIGTVARRRRPAHA